MFVVYQLIRERGKMLYMQTRIGTRTIVPLLPDILTAFVGDAIRVEDELESMPGACWLRDKPKRLLLTERHDGTRSRG